ncbi:hypothetical protein [Zavarzinella formosa]|uniref:hypothetical protein n=1 Tax=Zavarzinella formosa TaxID=360055 RepID=UPI000304BB51|nr:hypothetical protein [Zavarzinella formosa]
MKISAIAVRAGTLTSSILLIAGYISFRLGAFDRSSPPPVFDEEAIIISPAGEVAPDFDIRMYSSKSMSLVPPAKPIVIWGGGDQGIHMAGSKSMPLMKQSKLWGILFMEPAAKPQAAETPK